MSLQLPAKEILQMVSVDQKKDLVKQAIENLDPDALPLQQGLSHGSHVSDEPVNAIIIDYTEELDLIRAKTGIFYSSIIAGCSCADDPTPIDTNQEYCVLQFVIDKNTGEAEVELLPES